MATDTYTVSGNKATATQVVWAGNGPHLIRNLDLVNTVYVGDNDAINAGDSQGIIPVEPNGAYGVSGDFDLFAVVASGVTVQVASLLGGTYSFRGLTSGNGGIVIPITGVDFIINNQGWFWYSGPAAFGNLIHSETTYISGNPITQTTLDGFGNAVLPGNVDYSIGPNSITAVQEINGSVNWLQAATSAGPYVIRSQLFYSFPSGMTLASAPFTSTGGTAANPSKITTDVWHDLLPVVVTGYTVSLCRYRLTALNEMEFDLQMRAGAGGGTAGTYNLTLLLPGQYQPQGALARIYPLGYNGVLIAGGNAGSLLIDEAASVNSGRVRVQVGALPVNTDVGCTVMVPLDLPERLFMKERAQLRARARGLCGFLILLLCALVIYPLVVMVVMLVIMVMAVSSVMPQAVTQFVNSYATEIRTWYMETMARATIRRSWNRGSR